jgi:carbamoylphosphate synthase large subunit
LKKRKLAQGATGNEIRNKIKGEGATKEEIGTQSVCEMLLAL